MCFIGKLQYPQDSKIQEVIKVQLSWGHWQQIGEMTNSYKLSWMGNKLKYLRAGYMGNFTLPTRTRRFNRNPLLWSFICSFYVWVIWKKVIPARWNLACMKTGFWLNGDFFIYILNTKVEWFFLYNHDNTHAQTHANKLDFLESCFGHVLLKTK